MKRHDVKILSCCKARSDHGFPLIESVHAIELPEIPRDDRHTRGDCSNDRNHRAMPGTVIIGGENPRLFIDDPTFRVGVNGWRRGRSSASWSIMRIPLTPCVVFFRWHGSADRKSTRLNSSHHSISYAVFC